MALGAPGSRRYSSRRHTARWWLVIGVVASLLVLFVDAAFKARSPGPVRALAGQTWVDGALPIIARSTAQGVEINQVRSSGVSMTAGAITSELRQVASGSEATLAAARALRPPASITTAARPLVVCLQTRARAAGALAAAMDRTLSGPTGAAATASAPAIQSAGQQLQVADQAYRRFVQDMPPLGVKLPASAWYGDPAVYAQPGLSIYLQALRAATSDASQPAVALDAVTTTPPAVAANGAVEVLPPAATVTVTATVADVGDRAEPDLPVTATLSPAAPGSAPSARAFVSLTRGQDRTLTLGRLRPVTHAPVTLTVTVGPAAGETDTAEGTKVITFQMP